jgi:hypothetical protein
MRWAVEECRLSGAFKPILFVIAYRADRDTGECWAGQRRIAREAGVDPKTVERVIPRLIADGVLELVEPGRGPRPNCYRVAPAWVEGEASASGVVEGQASAGHVVEGLAEVAAGEILHRPEPSADIASALDLVWPVSVPTSEDASADIGRAPVPTSGGASADMVSPLTSENGRKVLEGLEAREGQVLDAAGSTADAAGGVEAYEPPPVDEATKAWLRRRGLGQRRPPPTVAHPPAAAADPSFERNRTQQLAELERRYPDDFKSGQEGEQSA